jgi:hypothetical protein
MDRQGNAWHGRRGEAGSGAAGRGTAGNLTFNRSSKMAQQFDGTNRGVISKNTRKELETHPDIRGQINVDGTEYWLDGWLKQRNDGTGSFYSLSVKPKNAPAATKPAQKAAQKPAPASGGFDDMDDSIPF